MPTISLNNKTHIIAVHPRSKYSKKDNKRMQRNEPIETRVKFFLVICNSQVNFFLYSWLFDGASLIWWQLTKNIALAKRAFWLAYTLNPFARGVHGDAIFLIVLFFGNCFYRSWYFLKHNSLNLTILLEMKKIIHVSYQISSPSFLPPF